MQKPVHGRLLTCLNIKHIHQHIVPRWTGDTNFMPMVADLRVMHEHLEETRAKLLPFFEGIGEG